MPITTFQLSSDALVVLLTCRPHWEPCPRNVVGRVWVERETIQDGMERRGVQLCQRNGVTGWARNGPPQTTSNALILPPSISLAYYGTINLGLFGMTRMEWGVGGGLPSNHQPGCEAGTPSKAPSEGACQHKDVHPLHTQAGLAFPITNPCLHSSNGACHMAGACVIHRLCRWVGAWPILCSALCSMSFVCPSDWTTNTNTWPW